MSAFIAFLGISFVMIATPGPDTALTIRNTLFGGRSAGVSTAIGIASGQIVWAVVTSVGAVALLIASEAIFTTIKYLGAGYLMFLGIGALRQAFRRQPADEAAIGRETAPFLSSSSAFRQGVLSNLGNPKMAVFFGSLLPQFVPAGEASFVSLMLLGLTFSAMTFAWLTVYAVLVHKAKRLMARPLVRRWLEAVTGTMLIALGIRLVVTER